jgi:hypothetical protein
MIKLSELKTLPFPTLRLLAIRVSGDIDAGEDKRDVLEQIFDAIKRRLES